MAMKPWEINKNKVIWTSDPNRLVSRAHIQTCNLYVYGNCEL